MELPKILYLGEASVVGLSSIAHEHPFTTKRVGTGLSSSSSLKGLRAEGSPPGPQILNALLNRILHSGKKDGTEAEEGDNGDIMLDANNPGPWLVDHHLHSLVQEVMAPPPTDGFPRRVFGRLRGTKDKARQKRRLEKQPGGRGERTFRVSFAEMQRMHLRKLQVMLVKHAVTMYSTKEETRKWEKDLAAYGKSSTSTPAPPAPSPRADTLPLSLSFLTY